jgi:protein-tyrosine kinase
MTTAEPRRHLVERAAEALGHVRTETPVPLTNPVLVDVRHEADAAPILDAPAAPAAGPATGPVPTREAEEGLVRRIRPAPIPDEALRRAGFATLQGHEARSRITEELSVVHHQLLRTIDAAEPAEDRLSHAVLITSAKPGEGKSFCSVNIAGRLAMDTAMQVILIDVDGTKKGSLSELLGQEASHGMDLLAIDPLVRPETLVVPTSIPRLGFMPYGPVPADSSARPSGSRLADALARLARAMPGRVLIVDAPPCLATSEPAAIASVVGQVVVVVQAESTQRGELESALDLLDGCSTLHLLLNRTTMASKDSFGAYDYNGG